MSAPKPFFGRAYKLKVTPQASGEEWTVANSDWDQEALRLTFSIEMEAGQKWWYADITVWNFDQAAAQVIRHGDLVTLEAGYQEPAMGLIFTGKVFQPIWERADNTNYTLTLHCFVGKFEDDNGYVSSSFIGGSSTLDCVNQVLTDSGIPFEYVEPSLADKKYPRGGAYSGPATKFFCDVAADNQLHYWMSWKGINIRSLVPAGDTPQIVYAPPQSCTSQTSPSTGLTKYILLGTPQQTQEGVTFRTLLDSAMQLGQLVKLDLALFNQVRLLPMQLPVFSDGLFVVSLIRFIGDTRGNDWYSDVVAYTREYTRAYAARQSL